MLYVVLINYADIPSNSYLVLFKNIRQELIGHTFIVILIVVANSKNISVVSLVIA